MYNHENKKDHIIRSTNLYTLFIYGMIISAPLTFYSLHFSGIGMSINFYRIFFLLYILGFMFNLKDIKFSKKIMFLILFLWLIFAIFLINFSRSELIIYANKAIMKLCVEFVIITLILIYIRNYSRLINIMKVYLFSSFLPIGLATYQLLFWIFTGKVGKLPFYNIVMKYPSEYVRGWARQIIIESSLGVPRIVSTMNDPSSFGIYLISVFSILIILYKTGEIRNKIFFNIFCFLILFIILFTFSRTSWVVWLIFMLLNFSYIFKYNFKFNYIAKYFIISIILLSLLLIPIHNNSMLSLLIDRTKNALNTSSTLFGREYFFDVGMKALETNPAWGIGYYNIANIPGYIRKDVSSTHNIYLNWLAELGLIGSLPMFLFIILIIYLLYKKNKENGWKYIEINRTLLSFLLALLVGNLFYPIFLGTPFIDLYLCILLAFISLKTKVAL